MIKLKNINQGIIVSLKDIKRHDLKNRCVGKQCMNPKK